MRGALQVLKEIVSVSRPSAGDFRTKETTVISEYRPWFVNTQMRVPAGIPFKLILDVENFTDRQSAARRSVSASCAPFMGVK
jgi:hypothetical protein